MVASACAVTLPVNDVAKVNVTELAHPEEGETPVIFIPVPKLGLSIMR